MKKYVLVCRVFIFSLLIALGAKSVTYSMLALRMGGVIWKRGNLRAKPILEFTKIHQHSPKSTKFHPNHDKFPQICQNPPNIYFASTSSWMDLALFWKKKWRHLMDFGIFGEIYRDLDEIWWILENFGGFW